MTLSLQQINWTINFHGLKPSESKCKRWLSPTVTLLRTLGTECRAMHAGGAGGGGGVRFNPPQLMPQAFGLL